jgi:hypothetical protein
VVLQRNSLTGNRHFINISLSLQKEADIHIPNEA